MKRWCSVTLAGLGSALVLPLAVGTAGVATIAVGPAASAHLNRPAPSRMLAALPHQVVATVGVGQRPVGIGVNPTTHKVYVTNASANTVSVIDGATDVVRATIPVGSNPFYWVGVMPGKNRVFFANNGSGTLGVIDGSTDTLVATVAGLSGAPEGVGVHEGRDRVYVTRMGSVLSVVDATAGRVVQDIHTGPYNHSAVVNPVLDRIYVSKTDPDELAVFDLATHTLVATVPATGHPAIDPATQRIWLTDFRAPRLWLVNGITHAVEGQVPLSFQPLLAAVDSVRGCLYATYPAAGRVGVVDIVGRREIGTLAVGRTPGGIGVDPTTGRVYVANEASNTVSVIEGARCDTSAVVTPTSAATRTATATPTHTATSTRTATRTATPTATSAATSTAVGTATPTTVPTPVYLPLVLRERCKPKQDHTDVVLVLDASTSMDESAGGGLTKLDAARDAARTFVSLMAFPDDQVALVTFNDGARLDQALTTDQSALEAALVRIATSRFTRLDLGVAEAGRELAGPRRRPGNRAAMIVLTDGRANPVGPAAAVDEAVRAKAAGVTVFTIGLGADLDTAALEAMASGADHFFVAPTAGDLAAIYRAIAGVIPCGGAVYWGRR